MLIHAARILSLFVVLVKSVQAACTPSAETAAERTICVTLDYHAGETGYYTMNGEGTPSPVIRTFKDQVIIFDQSDITNWYHPIGFAIQPDGAHGSDWGGAGLDEVEGDGELQYNKGKDNSGSWVPYECPDSDATVGKTGLDCYEPEFFYPRADWAAADDYSATLTIKQSVIDASHAGVIYYFCHIHSKMSGKIEIYTDSSFETKEMGATSSVENSLYSVTSRDAFDTKCGTTGITKFQAGGAKACSANYVPGTHNTDFETCLQAIDCQMVWDMAGKTTADHTSDIQTFMQQMIPHHQNAVNMAKLLLKTKTSAELSTGAGEEGEDVGTLEDTLYSIINVQNYQVHYFRNILNPDKLLLLSPETDPTTSGTSSVLTPNSLIGLISASLVILLLV